MAVKKFTFKKMSDGVPAVCWWCNIKTNFILTNNITGEEIFCCPCHALKKANVKRLKDKLNSNSTLRKSAKKNKIPLVKNSEVGFCGVVRDE